ncbi:hypothetical protein D3C77_791630 [compost metagenome]
MQIQLGLRQCRLGQCQIGVGFFNFLRAVTGQVLRQFVFRRLQVCLRLITRSAGIFQGIG